MSSYICEKCGCIDNTACGGNYHLVDMMNHSKERMFTDDYSNTHRLCVECTPSIYADGTVNRKAGKWHNHFTKRHWSEIGTKEYILEQCNKNEGNYVNANEYFNNT